MTTNERLAHLKAEQKAGKFRLCPRCGINKLESPLEHNVLSRHADIYICPDCGTNESLRDYMNAPLDLEEWHCMQPRKMYQVPDIAASMELIEFMHIPLLEILYLDWLSAGSPSDFRTYRERARAECPGVTQLWTEPFVAQYDTMDAPVMIRFRTTDDGRTEFSADIMTDKKNE